MTDAVWLACSDPVQMLRFLRGRLTDRKARLYLAAGLRIAWDLLYSDCSKRAVEVLERQADGAATEGEVRKAKHGAEVPTFGYHFEPETLRRHWDSAADDPDVRRLIDMGVYAEADIQQDRPLGDEQVRGRLLNAAHIAYHSLYWPPGTWLDDHLLRHLTRQTEWPGGWLVREVAGNPFRPVAFDPRCRTADTVGLACGIYEERAFDRLPLLADALMDAGCADEQVIGHCRGEGPHVRGCWVVDLVLGKE